MATENRLRLIPTANITIPEDRQRKEITTEQLEELRESIMRPAGLLNPIILRQIDGASPENASYELVAGECRLKAWKKIESFPPEISKAYRKGIPARLVSDLSSNELFDVEFEENYRRKDLNWKDQSTAFCEHYLRQQMVYEVEREEAISDGEPEEDWGEELPFTQAAGSLKVSSRHYRRMVTVGRKVLSGDKEVLACDSARAAGALLERRMKRLAENELATFGEVESDMSLEQLGGPSDVDLNNIELELGDDFGEPGLVVKNHYVLNQSFKGFISEAKDVEDRRRYNFVHCDFPYGKGLHESDLYNTDAKDMSYEDTPDIYWGLCSDLALAKSAGILSASCHIMFWFPMNFYTETVEFFRKEGFRVEPYPLVWIKSDKMGIIPDPTRGPRRIYETALIMSLGDRKVIKPTVNGAWADSGRRADALHVSSKPTEVLMDFFRMFVDEDSIVLDPTCGSGTALEASLLMRCQFAVGLDISEECVTHSEERAKSAQDQLLRGA